MQTIILDTDRALREFLSVIGTSQPLAAYFQNQGNLELREFINIILQYTVDYETARACVYEFAQEIKDVFSCEFAEPDIELLSQASLKLGLDILELLIQYRLYDHAGECWYTVDHLMGYDSVIKQSTPN